MGMIRVISILFGAALAVSGCVPTSKVAEGLFVPGGLYSAAVVEEAREDSSDLLVTDVVNTDEDRQINTTRPIINTLSEEYKTLQRCSKRVAFNSDAAKCKDVLEHYAYAYLSASDAQCEMLLSQIKRSAAASNTGFNLLSLTTSSVAAVYQNLPGANVLAGVSTLTNQLGGGINKEAQAIYANGFADSIRKNREAQTKDILQVFDKEDDITVSTVSKVRYKLQQYNATCHL